VASGSTDGLTGVAKYQYSTTSATGGFSDIPSNGQITLTAGNTIVYVRAVDNAGNAGSSISTRVYPLPVTNLSVQPNVNYTVALKCTASATSGQNTIYIEPMRMRLLPELRRESKRSIGTIIT